MSDEIKATYFRFKPGLSGEPVLAITDAALLEEILQHPQLKDYERSSNGDILLEVPSDLDDLTISEKLKSMLRQYKGKILCITP